MEKKETPKGETNGELTFALLISLACIGYMLYVFLK